MYSGNIRRIDKHEDTQMHKVLDLALKAGRISLSNGAEIFRVEETIEYICRHFGIEEMASFDDTGILGQKNAQIYESCRIL